MIPRDQVLEPISFSADAEYVRDGTTISVPKRGYRYGFALVGFNSHSVDVQQYVCDDPDGTNGTWVTMSTLTALTADTIKEITFIGQKLKFDVTGGTGDLKAQLVQIAN